MNFLGQSFSNLEHYRQTDELTHKQIRLKRYHAAFMSGNKLKNN